MAVKMLQLSLCIVIFIHLTSSQSTYDVSENEDDVTSCSGTDEVLRQLTTAVKQLQRTVSQLHRDVTDVKADVAAAWKPQRTVAGWSWIAGFFFTFLGILEWRRMFCKNFEL